MDYYNRKTSRRNCGGKKDKARENNASSSTTHEISSNNLDEKVNRCEHKVMDDSSYQSQSRGGHSKGVENGDKLTNPKVRDKSLDKKKEANADDSASSKSRNVTKGRKAKATKYLDNTCEVCGEEFDSSFRNKLHKHLGETGHTTLKFRW